MIPKPIVRVIDKNGEKKILNELSEIEQNEIREKITNKIIESFSKYIDRKGLSITG